MSHGSGLGSSWPSPSPLLPFCLGNQCIAIHLVLGACFMELQCSSKVTQSQSLQKRCWRLLLSLLTLGSSPPVDTTRVALRDVDESVPGSDYINANYIKVPGEGRAARGGCLHPAAGVGMQYWCKSGGSSVSGAICIPRVRVFLPYPQGISPFYQVLFALIQELISIPSFPYLLGRS